MLLISTIGFWIGIGIVMGIWIRIYYYRVIGIEIKGDWRLIEPGGNWGLLMTE